MIRLPSSCHVTLSLLLLVLKLALASSSSSSSSPSSSASSAVPSSSHPPISPIYLLTSPSESSSSLHQSSLPPQMMNSQPSRVTSSDVQVSQSQHAPSAHQGVAPMTSQPGSGVAIPTKRDQFKNNASEKDKKLLTAVEKLFLKHAGLQRRPRSTRKSSVPGYMLELYRSQVDNSGAPNTYLKLKGNGLIAANTVRSFLHTDKAATRCTPPLCSRVHFDVSTITSNEKIAGAELRIFTNVKAEPLPHSSNSLEHHESNTHNAHRNTLGNSKSSAGPSDTAAAASSSLQLPPLPAAGAPVHRLEIHEIMRPESADDEAVSRLLDTRVISLSNSSWHTFDIQPAVLRWTRDKARNHGLEVRLVSRRPIVSTAGHVRVRRSDHVHQTTWDVERPVLVVYTDDGDVITTGSRRRQTSSSSPTSSSSASPSSSSRTTLHRSRRQAGGDNGGKNDKNKNSKNKRDRKRNRRKNRKRRKKKKKRRRKKKGNKNICKRHGLYVDFNDVGWDDWIVAPAGYNAYYCHGDCMAPLPYFSKASHHAMLQARVYKVSPSAVPMVCCVPIKMSPIPMLYMDEKGRTVLKNYQEMSVEECGCQ